VHEIDVLFLLCSRILCRLKRDLSQDGFQPVACRRSPGSTSNERIILLFHSSIEHTAQSKHDGQDAEVVETLKDDAPCTATHASLLRSLAASATLHTMPRKVKALPGPSRLSGILASLKQEPRPVLSAAVKRISLSYAAKNDHFGARCVRLLFPYAWSLTGRVVTLLRRSCHGYDMRTRRSPST
jgi:hypothetical protein